MTELDNAEQEKLREHLKAIAKILYHQTPSDKLKTFEDIEIILREKIQKEIAPEIAQFFFQKSAKLKLEDQEK